MNGNGKVSVPEHKAGGPKTPSPVKTDSAVKGFGGGSTHGSLEGNDAIQKAGRSVKGFSGSGVKGGKV
jgi:hypothetical protein